jgi:peroxiredoxin
VSERVLTPAPEFELPSVAGEPVRLADLHADGPALVVFVAEECPTSAMTLRRLAPLVQPLASVGVRTAAVFEDPLEVAARVARRAGFTGTVLEEPPPYGVSSAYDLVSVPTTVLVDRDGQLAGRVVGWDAEGLDELLEQAGRATGAPTPALTVTDEHPRRKPGCAAKSTYDAETLRLLDGAGVDELEDMFERGWSDGLPVIPPTRERVEAMLGGRDPAQSLGEVPPAMGEATLERIAAFAVLAGCRPEYFPVVVAAVQAALEPGFNLGGQAVTTQPAGQLVIVNGPVRDAIGLNSSIGALGPGWRPNMTIGRALRLVVSLTGGGFPGRLDRSTLGNPGKLGLCLAEDEETSPWEPLHVERGFESERSVVTLIGADAPLSISDHRSTNPEELARVLGFAAAATWSPNWWPLGGISVFVICPEHAELFRAAGWSKQHLREEMFEAVRRPAGELRWGETTPHVNAAADEELVSKWDSPDDIVLVVAGGEAGRYSAVFGPCLGMKGQVVSKEISWTTT